MRSKSIGLFEANSGIAVLVQGFARNIQQLKVPAYKESRARLDYIDPFWRLLGWDVDNTKHLPPQDVEVLVEPSMDSIDDEGFTTRAPDYLFRPGSFPRFIVEAKKPAIDVNTDRAAIFQTKRYAWSGTIPFAILTNFDQFRLFDTTLQPRINEPDRGLVQEFRLSFADYPAQWDVLLATFGRDAVAAGSLEALRAKIRKVPAGRRIRTVDRMLIDLKGDEPIDRVFLAYLDVYRKHFARAIYRDNRSQFPEADTLHGAARLTEAVQRLMDRLVFMRVCEDRGIAEWGGIRSTLDRIGGEGGNLYRSLCAEFRALDASYNGYLFKPHFCEELEVDGGTLSEFIRELYPPDGPWDFSKIGDDILGIVYERFLGNVVIVRKHQAEVEEKPEVRHAGGVYYTPRFIVDTIIRRVVGPQIAGKSPSEVLDIKILDPACGSGSFLVAAFQYLIDHCIRTIAADPKLASVPASPKARKKRKEIAFKDSKGGWHLAPDFKAALLTNCIHGVDIDRQAVEVTVMSLYLKMLEGALPKNWQKDWIENQLLPSLDNNIRCGNSLIDSQDFDLWCEEQNGTLFPLDDEDVRFRINRFDWTSRTRGFGRILDEQSVKERGRAGFDCIIGNPPYIRVQELNKWAPEECEFYKWCYKSAAKGNYDIYVVFTEKALGLLSPNGLLGFIMPHKFWQAKYGEGLRKVIANGKHLCFVVDFTDQQVFDGATTYTAVHLLAKSNKTSQVDIARITELEDGAAQCAAIDSGRPTPGVLRFEVPAPLASAAWHFHTATTRDLLATMRANSKLLYPDVCKSIFQGIVTGADSIFLSNGWTPHPSKKKLVRFHSAASMLAVDVELASTVPVVRRQGFDSYCSSASQLLLLPYDRKTERLLPESEMRVRYPNAWAYLKQHKEKLAQREKGRFAKQWWSLSRAQNIRLWCGSKILVPYMINRLQAVYDSTGAFFVNVTTGGYGLEIRAGLFPKSFSFPHYYIVGLLNSRLLDHCMRHLSNHFHGGYYPANKQFLQHLPIKLPQNKDENKLACRIVEHVHEIIDAKVMLPNRSLSDRERTDLERTVDRNERRIDEAVFELYGVKGLPNE